MSESENRKPLKRNIQIANKKIRLDFIVMPLVILGLTALQFDRVNIGNAVTDDFLVNVGINQSQFNIGQQLLSVGIVLLEVSLYPGNCI